MKIMASSVLKLEENEQKTLDLGISSQRNTQRARSIQKSEMSKQNEEF